MRPALALSAVLAALGSFVAAATGGPQPPLLPSACSDSSPCRLHAGMYRLGPATVLEGLQFTLPSGWSSTENDGGELKLVPPGRPEERLFVWMDLVAVRSTGKGHGKPLAGVGRTPARLIAWMVRNPDFEIVSRPAPSSLVRGVRMTTLALRPSASARYGEPECPSNPRCADVVKDPKYWGPDDSYGIGYPEEVRLYVGTIRVRGAPHTFFVALDAEDHGKLVRLTAAARSIIASLRLPAGVRGGA